MKTMYSASRKEAITAEGYKPTIFKAKDKMKANDLAKKIRNEKKVRSTVLTVKTSKLDDSGKVKTVDVVFQIWTKPRPTEYKRNKA